jgi:hypothetical protein
MIAAREPQQPTAGLFLKRIKICNLFFHEYYS